MAWWAGPQLPLAGLCQHLAPVLAGELAGEVAVCEHGLLLPVGGWPAIPALIGKLACPAMRAAGAGSPLLRRGGGRGEITHRRRALVPGAAVGRAWLDQARPQGQAGQVGAAPGTRSCPGSGPGGS